MLNPITAPIVVDIVNLFAKYKLPIISRDSIFEDVKLVMDTRSIEPVDGPNSILSLEDLVLKYYAVPQCRGCDKYGYKRK